MFDENCVPVVANNPPIAIDQTFTATTSGEFGGRLKAKDPDGDALVEWTDAGTSSGLAYLEIFPDGAFKARCAPKATAARFTWTVKDEPGGLTSTSA